MRIRHQFRRVPLPGGEHLEVGWFAVSHRFESDASRRRRLRNKWVRLKSDYGTIYRVLRFAPNLAGGPAAAASDLAVDYQGWWELQGLNVPELKELSIEIRQARLWEIMVAHWHHPDPAQRSAMILAHISLGLGILSLWLALPWPA